MKSRKFSASEFRHALLKSIQVGKQNYLFLFLGAGIYLGVTKALEASDMGLGSILSSLFGTLWIAGSLSVSQSLIYRDSAPNLSQYFIGFSKSELTKRLLPSFIYSMVVSVIYVILIAFLGGFAMFAIQHASSTDELIHTSKTVAVVTQALSFFLFMLVLPASFIAAHCLLHELPWKTAVRSAIDSTLQNLPMLLVLLLPQTLILGAGIVFTLQISNESAEATGSAIKFGASWLKTAMEVTMLIFSPFFTTLNYQIYKKAFEFDKPELVLSAPAVSPNITATTD